MKSLQQPGEVAEMPDEKAASRLPQQSANDPTMTRSIAPWSPQQPWEVAEIEGKRSSRNIETPPAVVETNAPPLPASQLTG